MNKIVVDKTRLFRRVIILSWASLALCFIIKIFGGNFFEIMCDNPNYKALCEYADTHFWVKYILGVCSSMICQSLYNLSIIQKTKMNWKEFTVTFISVLLSSLVKYYNNVVLGIAFDIWLCFILPIILLGKEYRKYWYVLIAWLLTFIFQLVSLITKNLSITIMDDSTFITLIYGIDVYIMCFLYYLYRNIRKEKNEMGMFWVMFMGKPENKLLKMRARSEKRIAKEQEKVCAINLELSKRKAEK